MSKMSKEDYMKQIKGVIEPMVNALLMTTPEEPIYFMLQWLANFNKVTESSYINKEREELEKLRYELNTYKKAKIRIKSEDLLNFDKDESELINEKSVKRSMKQSEKSSKIEMSRKNEEDNKSEEEDEKSENNKENLSNNNDEEDI